MKQIYSIVLSILITLSVNGQWTQLTDPLLSGVKSSGAVYTGTTFLVTTQSGVFRSTDNGITWTMANTGLDTANTEVRDLAFVSSRSEIWLTASNGLFKSTNQGTSWSRVQPSGLPSDIWFDDIGTIGSRLVVMYSYWDNMLSKQVIRLGYTDNGTEWTPGALLTYDWDSYCSMIFNDNDKNLYLSENSNIGAGDRYWSTSNGTTLQQVVLTGLDPNPDINDRSLSVDPSGDNLFYTDENSGKIYRYNPGENRWDLKMNGISLENHTLGMVFKAHSLTGRLFCTALFVSPEPESTLVMKFFTSTDNGENWVVVPNPGVTYPLFEKWILQIGSGRLIGEDFNSNLSYSDDNGQTWIVSTGIQAGEFDRFISLANGSLYAVTNSQTTGIIKSTDNGSTWTPQNGNLPNFQGIYLIDGIVQGGNYIYVTAAEDPFTEKPYLFLSTDLAETWTKLASAPDSSTIKFVGMNGIWPIYFFSDDDGNGTYQFTKDAGTTWINVSPAINGLGLDEVQGLRGNGNLGMLILFGYKSGRTRVYLSANDGGSFTDITTNLDFLPYELLRGAHADWDDPVRIVSTFRQDGAEFLVAAIDYGVMPNEIIFLKLNSTKDEWIKVSTTGLPFSYQMNSYRLAHRGGVYYFISSVAVYASVNNGAAWKPIWNNEGYPGGSWPGSWAMNNYGSYFGTVGAGIWRAQLTTPTINTLPATAITDTTAASGMELISTGGLPFGGKGIVWSLMPGPTTADNVHFIDDTWAGFTDTLRPLIPNTTYYARSFVFSPMGFGSPVYGNEISFKTDNATRIETGINGTILLYPNPSDGRFSIVSEAQLTMTIMDVSGKDVMSRRLDAGINEVTMVNPKPGVYFVRLAGPGKETHVIRMLVK